VRALLGLIDDDGLTALAAVLARFPDLAKRVSAGEDEALSTRLRKAEQIGRPVGAASLLATVEQLSGRRLIPAKPGPRPKADVGRE
jgi:putative transposase